jgi:SWIM/SEC-C metal-binding protein
MPAACHIRHAGRDWKNHAFMDAGGQGDGEHSIAAAHQQRERLTGMPHDVAGFGVAVRGLMELFYRRHLSAFFGYFDPIGQQDKTPVKARNAKAGNREQLAIKTLHRSLPALIGSGQKERGGKMAQIGAKKKPIIVRVQTQEAAQYVMQRCTEHGWEVIVGIEPDKPEMLADLERALHHPIPVHVEKTGRNAPCPCGSGKKCCGAS